MFSVDVFRMSRSASRIILSFLSFVIRLAHVAGERRVRGRNLARQSLSMSNGVGERQEEVTPERDQQGAETALFSF